MCCNQHCGVPWAAVASHFCQIISSRNALEESIGHVHPLGCRFRPLHSTRRTPRRDNCRRKPRICPSPFCVSFGVGWALEVHPPHALGPASYRWPRVILSPTPHRVCKANGMTRWPGSSKRLSRQQRHEQGILPTNSLGLGPLKPLPTNLAFCVDDNITSNSAVAGQLQSMVRRSLQADLVKVIRFGNCKLWQNYCTRRDIIASENDGDPSTPIHTRCPSRSQLAARASR